MKLWLVLHRGDEVNNPALGVKYFLTLNNESLIKSLSEKRNTGQTGLPDTTNWTGEARKIRNKTLRAIETRTNSRKGLGFRSKEYAVAFYAETMGWHTSKAKEVVAQHEAHIRKMQG